MPKGELLVLDLGGSRNDFWGHNFIKGQLHNFGGRINLHGDLRAIAANPFAATAAKVPQCVGLGLFPEAIIQNPVFYDCVFDMIWREWSGLISRFYLPRWQKFHAMLGQSIATGDYRDPRDQVHGREAFRANPFYTELGDWEINFSHNPPQDLPTPSGDSVDLATKFLAAYYEDIETTNTPEFQNGLTTTLITLESSLPDNSIVVGAWKSGEVAATGKTITLDVSGTLKDEGDYEISFHYRSGGKRLEIEWVALLVNGNENTRNTHTAWAGIPAKDTVFSLHPGAIVFNGKYKILAKVKIHGGNTSNGIITLRKIPR